MEKEAFLTDEFDRYRYDQARAWLEHVRGLGRKADALRAAADEQRELLSGVRGVDYGRGGGGAPSPDAVPNAVAAIERAVSAYCSALAEFLDEQRDARLALSRLEKPEHFEVLARRYCDGWEWERICAAMGYTYDGAMALHRRAVAAAYDVMPPGSRDPRHPAI